MTDYYSLLEKKIDEVKGDPIQSRRVVYDLARYALKNKAYARDPNLTVAQINEQMIALELAIALVEANAASRETGKTNGHAPISSPDDKPPTPSDFNPEPSRPEPSRPEPRETRSGRELVVLPPRRLRRADRFDDEDDDYRPLPRNRSPQLTPEAAALIKLLVDERQSRSRRVFSWMDGAFRLAFVAVLALGIYAVWSGKITEWAAMVLPPPVQPSAVAEAPKASEPAASAQPTGPVIPRPSVYGVYALHDNQLVGLQTVPTTPVDPRTRNLLQITTPSRTIFEDGRLTFTIYRRDLVTSAPVVVPIRIAARIASTMKFGPGGTLITVKPDTDTWLIYHAGYDFRVLPVADNPEMVLIQPDDPDFVLPPGRYVLLLGDQPYDFTVAGKVTDPRSCVEGAATPRGPVFYECKPEVNRPTNG